jgi:hypothetical protein
MTIALFLLGAAGLWAAVCWVRMRYYRRREKGAIRHDLALMDQAHALRFECDRLFWELGEEQWT